MKTSLKAGFAQIFSCCPKNLSCPKFGGAAAPLAPPARTPMYLPLGLRGCFDAYFTKKRSYFKCGQILRLVTQAVIMQLISVVRISICFKYNWNGKKKWHYRESQLLQIVLLSFRPYKFLGTYRSCTAVPTSLTRFSKGISSFCPQAGASTAGDWRGDELEREFKAKNPFRNGFAIIHFRLSFHRDKPWQNKDCFILQCIKCWENR